MAHKSRVGVFVFDCEAADLNEASQFWSAALGATAKVDDDGKYAELEGVEGGAKLLLQTVDHPSRIHLDIETDDREAEAARLEALGAVREGWVRNWIIMRAPTGHRFCLVEPQSDDFANGAKSWG